MQNIIQIIGQNGNIINFIITLLAIHKNTLASILLTIGFIVNNGINKYIKSIYKEERPIYDNKNKEDYGFPSNHAQEVTYMFVYLCLLGFTQNKKYVFITAIIALITIFQRYIYHYHTIKQLVAGMYIGGVVAILVYFVYLYLFRLL